MKPKPALDAAALRRAAETRLREQGAGASPQNEADLRKLHHELEVHQIELEMQNEELRAAHAVITTALEQYSDHFDFAPVGYFNLTADGTIKLVNLAGAKLVGIERARLQERRFMLLVAETDRRAFSDFLAQVFETKTRHTCELALSVAGRPDLFVRLEAALSSDGRECCTAILDITELKRAEEAQRHSGERLAGIVNSAMDAMISIDSGQRILLFNAAAEQMFGYRAGDVAGKSLDILLPDRLRATHTKHVKGFAESGVTTRKMGLPNAVTGLRANGEEFPIEASISQVLVAGEILCTVILRDISQRVRVDAALRESEARYRSLFDNMLNGYVLCQMIFDQDRPQDYIYVAVNTAFETLTGLKNVIGRKISDVLPGIREADPELFEVFGQVVRTGVPERFEMYIHSMEMWFWISAYRPAPGQFAVVFDVITERKLAEQKLRQSEEQMRALAVRLQIIREEERMQIAREIHDVLAQELTLLKFNVVWASRRLAKALDESTGAAVAEKLQTITEQTESAIHTVQKIATDLRPVVLDRLGLGAAIEWQAADFERRTGIVCRANVPAELPSVSRDHATAVFRILQESLTNVVRHSQATRADVALVVDHEHLIMSVRDNGCGMSPGKLSDMHSIGLAGMRERALVFGGRVDIASAPGAGTTVTVQMPLRRSTENSKP